MNKNLKEFICPECSSDFQISVYANRKLCTDCAKRKRQVAAREHDRRRRPAPVHSLVCCECKTRFDHQGMGPIPKYCPDCKKQYARLYEKNKRQRGPKNSEALKSTRLKHRYGLSSAQYQEVIDLKDGTCYVCEKAPAPGKSLYIDHNHACCPGEKSCGKCVRGALCQACNSALGQIRDNVQSLEYLIKYLENGGSHSSPNSTRVNQLTIE